MLDDIKCGPVFLSLFVTTYAEIGGVPVGTSVLPKRKQSKPIHRPSQALSSRTLNRGLTQLRHASIRSPGNRSGYRYLKDGKIEIPGRGKESGAQALPRRLVCGRCMKRSNIFSGGGGIAILCT